MSHGVCEKLSAIAADDMKQHGESYLALLQQGAAPGAFLDLIAQQCPPALAAQLYDEFEELPLEMVMTIVRGWALTSQLGLAFDIQSVAPTSPLDFARRRNTRLTMDMDNDGVTFGISHVPGRHAEWQRGAVAVGAV